ncbi:bifunctional diaminohydroxyphosphoribosylaminopyrimidine deaminase/5-amino-6-(5-phosphoribosylamino)uracil reductase RibD [Brotaphodocola sp.]|uniref:bifunctional diaminohydroxyphosphoribosylaminopyrimidine deaminase/5-amino-6-(5-phosphoribosylamino)uracil reductase RibD n=1 Tax=Brotaphodocola sp. TaxID=3073577 RepID=UPI003D7D43CC
MADQNDIDQKYMRIALELAKKGTGRVSPNPLVGAVLVKNGEIIGSGYHAKYGEAHAERNALASCTESPEGATLYVTLEPCCHYGKQPPCTLAVLEAKIARVVVGSGDPNPLVAGKGIEILRNHGVEVTEHVLEQECRELNRVFFWYIRTGLPYVVMKYAMTLDGKIATATGASKWITGEQARAHVQSQRNRYTAIMAGIGTVLADDPLLTCRIEGGRNPIRIICDTNLRTSLSSKIVETADRESAPVILATCCQDVERIKQYEQRGCQVLIVQECDGHLNLNDLMRKLGEMKIDSILLEGGGTLNWSFLSAGLVNHVQAYLAPKLFGGGKAKTPIEGEGVRTPDQAVRLSADTMTVTRLGEDFLIEGEIERREDPDTEKTMTVERETNEGDRANCE